VIAQIPHEAFSLTEAARLCCDGAIDRYDAAQQYGLNLGTLTDAIIRETSRRVRAKFEAERTRRR